MFEIQSLTPGFSQFLCAHLKSESNTWKYKHKFEISQLDHMYHDPDMQHKCDVETLNI